jgi:hypothetical protein
LSLYLTTGVLPAFETLLHPFKTSLQLPFIDKSASLGEGDFLALFILGEDPFFPLIMPFVVEEL